SRGCAGRCPARAGGSGLPPLLPHREGLRRQDRKDRRCRTVSSPRSTAASSRQVRPRKARRSGSRITLWVVCFFIGVWLVAPTLVVIPLSFNDQRSLAFPPKGFSLQWYANFFTDSQWVGGLLNSVQIAILVAVLATVLGTLA